MEGKGRRVAGIKEENLINHLQGFCVFQFCTELTNTAQPLVDISLPITFGFQGILNILGPGFTFSGGFIPEASFFAGDIDALEQGIGLFLLLIEFAGGEEITILLHTQLRGENFTLCGIEIFLAEQLGGAGECIIKLDAGTLEQHGEGGRGVFDGAAFIEHGLGLGETGLSISILGEIKEGFFKRTSGSGPPTGFEMTAAFFECCHATIDIRLRGRSVLCGSGNGYEAKSG